MFNKRERLEDWALNKKENMKNMSFSEKIKWYFSYYWVQIGLVLAAIMLCIYFIWTFTIGKQEVWINVSFVNINISEESVAEYADEFADYIGINPKKQLVEFDNMYSINVDSEIMDSASVNSYAKFSTLYSAGNMNVLISKEDFHKYFRQTGYYYQDISTIMGDEWISNIADKFGEDAFCYTENKDGDKFIYGIYIDGTDFAKKTGIDGEKYILSIPFTCKETEHVKEFINYLYSN